jgi:PAS domain S-box-containing protein
MPKNNLSDATKGLAFQMEEKEKRAEDLTIATKELAFQNEEKEKRAAELIIANYARSLIEASLDPLVTISATGKILDVNAASIKVTGIPRENLIGTDFSNYFTEPKKAQEGYQQVFAKGFVADYPLTIKHKDGNLTDVLYNASVYKDDKGNVLGVFAAARDVTEQKQASQYARSLIEASLDPLVTISANGKITDVNAASIKVTGIQRKNLIGTDFSNYFTEPKKAKEGYQQVFDKGFVADYPLTIKHKNGTLTDVLYNATVYKDDKGNVLGVFAAARDVTEQKWAIDLRIANKELVVQNEEKEKRAEELGIIVKELESFNYISSHDLQEPLRQIQMFCSRISSGELKHLSDAGKTYFGKINNAAKRMQNLINDLLAYSRTKTEARKFKIINLNEIINEVKEEFEEIISDKHATVEVAELGVANVITFQFRQLMHNLIGNALKFSKPETPPHIIIKNEKVKSNQVPNADQLAETEYYHISITDNGIGFEQQYKDRIFEVFQRLHDKQKIAGTGIGLAIVKNIVENHNGIITATGELNKGATFDVYIPTIQKL